jgi:hypothetical protein
MNNIKLHLYLRLDRRQKSKSDARVNTSQPEQYGGTIHLFIGTGRNLCEITFMPFMFTVDLRTIYRGLDTFSSLSRFLFLLLSRSFLARSFGAGSTFIPTMLFTLCIASFRVRRFLYIYYTWETLLIRFLRTFGRRRPPTGLITFPATLSSLFVAVFVKILKLTFNKQIDLYC